MNDAIARLATQRWDLVVIGSGPAGAVAAAECARHGAGRVLIVDRATFPRTKVCGCCLSPLAQSALRALGLEHILDVHDAPSVNHLELRHGQRTASVRLRPQPVLSRSRLDLALLDEAARRGCHVGTGVHASIEPTTETEDEAVRRVRLRDVATGETTQVETAVVIDATGLRGRPDHVSRNSPFGAGTVISDPDHLVPAGRIVMAIGDAGYVGMTRLEDDTVVLGAAVRGGRVRANSDTFGRDSDDGPWWTPVMSILKDAGVALPRTIHDARWRGTPLLTQKPDAAADHRLFRVGDAAGYVEPFTGEGMGWAMEGARRLAPLAVNAARRWSSDYRAEWDQVMHRFATWRTLRCRSIAWTLAHPGLVHPVMWIGSRWPRLASGVARGLIA